MKIDGIHYPDYILDIPGGYNPIKTKGACYYDPEAAQDAIDFIQGAMIFTQGARSGTPFLLEDWQKCVVCNLFGWKRPDGLRRYREVFMFIPRKNGKTAFISAIMGYICFCDNEPGAQNYSAASEKEQASIIFNNLKDNIEKNDLLEADTVKIYKSFKSIEFVPNKAMFKSLSAEGKSKHGQNIHALIVDELHCIEDRELLDALTTAQGSRAQPITLYITTAGNYNKHSICFEEYETACKIRDGLDCEYYLPIIYELPKDAEWDDQSNWYKCNPNLGVSVYLDFLIKECNKAKIMPSKENAFRRLYLNQWVEQAERWLPIMEWDKSSDAPSDNPNLNWYLGIDLSSTRDLTCVAAVARDDSGRYHFKIFPYIPEDAIIEREKSDKVPFRLWRDQGHITATSGNVVDYDVVRGDINDLRTKINIVGIGLDGWNATHLMTQLQSDSFDVTQIGMSFKYLNSPSKMLEVLILKHMINHGGHPVLRWCVSNVAADEDKSERIMPSKKRSTQRIDCIVAIIIAMCLQMLAEEISDALYETQGIRSL